MKLKETEVLVLRKTNEDMTSNGVKFPRRGWVESHWNAMRGFGIHGLEWGAGEFHLEHYGRLFQVIKVDMDDGYVNFGDKVMFRKGYVLFTTDSQFRAISYIKEHAPEKVVMQYDITTEKHVASWDHSIQKTLTSGRQKSGDHSTQTAGSRSVQSAGKCSIQKSGAHSTQSAGYESTQTAGRGSIQTAGSDSIQTAGDRSTQTAAYSSIQNAGYESTQTAHSGSIQTAGRGSTQTAGRGSIQTAGRGSIQTAGDRSTQIAGNNSVQKAGEGTVQICRWVEAGRMEIAMRIVTIEEAGVPYLFNDGVWIKQCL